MDRQKAIECLSLLKSKLTDNELICACDMAIISLKNEQARIEDSRGWK